MQARHLVHGYRRGVRFLLIALVWVSDWAGHAIVLEGHSARVEARSERSLERHQFWSHNSPRGTAHQFG